MAAPPSGAGLRCQCAQRTVSRRPRSACVAAMMAPVASGRSNVRLSFRVAHRVNFGQKLCIVGAQECLGSWNVGNAVEMDWSDGDVWNACLDVPAEGQVQLEYKYVVLSDGGEAIYWKPGGNCQLEVPLALPQPPAAVKVTDSWDECGQEVQLEGTDAPAAGSSSSRLVDGPAASPPPPPPPAPTAVGVQEHAGASAAYAPPPPLADPANEMDIVAAAADRAMQELDVTISNSTELLDGLPEAASPEAFVADRSVAAAARRAIALTKALSAADPGYNYRLAAPKDKSEEGDGPQQA